MAIQFGPLELARQGRHPMARAAAEMAVGPARIGRAGWRERHVAALAAAERRANERAVRWLEAEYASRRRAAAAAEKAARDAAGYVALRGIYGRSYFGSGGAYGSAKGENVTMARASDGFVEGVIGATVADRTQPARLRARGGDCIGEGREWREEWVWDPATQSWSEVRS